MNNQIESIAFIGGGRLTYILLQGLKRKNALPSRIFVSDHNPDKLKKILSISPETIKTSIENKNVVKAQILFLSIHPNVFEQVAEEIKNHLEAETIVVSCIPTITMKKISEYLNEHKQLVRIIPNAHSIVGKGYNPFSFHPSVTKKNRKKLKNLAIHWGKLVEVEERDLEAYAIITGMGPTYFWFQWLELLRLAQEFGIEETRAKEALSEMLHGAVITLLESDLSAEEVLDLIPTYPLKKNEEEICRIFTERLSGLWQKLKSVTC